MVLTTCLLALILIWRGAGVNAVVPLCDQHVFWSNVDNCLSEFNKSVEASGYKESCPWPSVKSFYARLKHCVDDWAMSSWCKGCGFLVDEVFFGVHQTYFSLCGYIHDPPVTTLMMLTLPVIIATLSVPFLFIRIARLDTSA